VGDRHEPEGKGQVGERELITIPEEREWWNESKEDTPAPDYKNRRIQMLRGAPVLKMPVLKIMPVSNSEISGIKNWY
jgi:hypothetical protein